MRDGTCVPCISRWILIHCTNRKVPYFILAAHLGCDTSYSHNLNSLPAHFQFSWILDHLTCLLRNLYACQEATVRARHGTTDWFQIGKGVKAVYFHPAYLTSMQNTSCEMLSWVKHKLESRLLGEISNNLRYADDTTLMAESEEELKSLLIKVKENSDKVDLKLNIQKAKIWHLVPSLHGK